MSNEYISPNEIINLSIILSFYFEYKINTLILLIINIYIMYKMIYFI